MADKFLNYLGGNHVEQALFDIEYYTYHPSQHQLVEAVLDGDAATVSNLVKTQSSTELISEGFSLPFFILLFSRGSLDVLKAFIEHGSYSARSGVDPRRISSEGPIGEIALRVCPAKRQKELLDLGYLSIKDHALLGMSSADKEVFDLWSAAYLQEQKDNPDIRPSATNMIFRWLPDVERVAPSGHMDCISQERRRRFEKLRDGFLDAYYPGDTALERWEQFIKQPPGVKQSALGAAEATAYMKALIDVQLTNSPQLREVIIPVDEFNSQYSQRGHLIHALLQSGYSFEQFDADLVDELVKAGLKALRNNENPPEILHVLWREVLARVQKEDPERLETLPSEMTQDGGSLQLLKVFKTTEERVAFCEMVELQRGSAQVKSSWGRPRL